MSLKPVATEVTEPKAWNALVASFPFHSALQGFGWGEVKRLSGWRPLRLKISLADKTIAAIQLLRRSVGPFGLLYAPRGPALEKIEDLTLIAQTIKFIAKSSDLSLKIEPPLPVESEKSLDEQVGPFRYVESIQPEHTVLLDLTQSEQDLLNNMHQMAKRNTKTSLKLGVETKIEDDFETFWRLFSETNQRSKLMSHSIDYYRAVLRECGQNGEFSAIITARYQDVPLATGMVIGLGNNINYLYGGSTRNHPQSDHSGWERDPKGSNAFYWGMMMVAKEKGYKNLDLFGIPRKLDENSHAFGVYQFKERLGGQKVRFPAYEIALNPLANLANGVLRLRKNIMNYRARGTSRDIL